MKKLIDKPFKNCPLVGAQEALVLAEPDQMAQQAAPLRFPVSGSNSFKSMLIALANDE